MQDKEYNSIEQQNIIYKSYPVTMPSRKLTNQESLAGNI